jgi:type II secretory pathway predicted ATPase ExeA
MKHMRCSSTPFTREIKVEHRFRVEFLDHEIDALMSTIEKRMSAAVIAPAGCGKSVVVRSLLAQLPAARYRTHYFKLADLSVRDMCRQMAQAIGVQVTGSYPCLVHAIEERLRSGFDDSGMRQVLIIDDAQEMRDTTLRILKLVTNFDMDARLVVSVILAGQIPLKTCLSRPGLEDVKQRLAYCGELRLLTREETRAYIAHRCKIVGFVHTPFENTAIDAIYEITAGNMRAIDAIALHALEEADRNGRTMVETPDVVVARSRVWM